MILRLFKLKKMHIYFTTLYCKGVQSYSASTKVPTLTVFVLCDLRIKVVLYTLRSRMVSPSLTTQQTFFCSPYHN